MTSNSEELAPRASGLGVVRLSSAERARAYYELAKPNLSMLVVVTSILGFYLASSAIEHLDWARLIYLVTGTALTAAGACALNMYIERDIDARMMRTKHRPIPSGRLSAQQALAFSLVVFTWGFLQLLVFCGPYPAFLSLATALIYAFVYTPAKRRGPISIWIGAIPGAIPPVMGWAAVRGEIGWGGLSLFLILFAWQFPHFLALAYMYEEDYRRGGFEFLFADDPDGQKVGRAIAFGTLLVHSASLAPYVLGLVGGVYLVGAILAGAFFVWAGARVAVDSTLPRARQAFFASITYLPVLLASMVLDRLVS